MKNIIKKSYVAPEVKPHGIVLKNMLLAGSERIPTPSNDSSPSSTNGLDLGTGDNDFARERGHIDWEF